MSTSLISKHDLLTHWLGHRNLTRRVIEKFPEDQLFTFHVENMRTFADLIKELLSLAVPGLEGIVHQETKPYDHDLPYNTKEALLQAWDEATPQIEKLFLQIPEERFPEDYNLFGQYNFPIIYNILYFIDNEVHHRGQGFVYLRMLGIEPPFFWDREKN
ncbi:DinB family protein [Sphingobacterium corticibacter]|uniref:Damage-inducible protein DinB n=1 Tax=Sphingobacterium corticibacter TaxID=2171749 RepID=A0A2T8HHQ4_9SPHI|nr:DinB family protein [Sphingobacterium corticibacter]PVH24969.1 damage-inducible protein DinB [Sphingobacterium corticibacter]